VARALMDGGSEAREPLARVDIPEPHGAVDPAGRDQARIRADRKHLDSRRLPERRDLLEGQLRPNPRGPVGLWLQRSRANLPGPRRPDEKLLQLERGCEARGDREDVVDDAERLAALARGQGHAGFVHPANGIELVAAPFPLPSHGRLGLHRAERHFDLLDEIDDRAVGRLERLRASRGLERPLRLSLREKALRQVEIGRVSTRPRFRRKLGGERGSSHHLLERPGQMREVAKPLVGILLEDALHHLDQSGREPQLPIVEGRRGRVDDLVDEPRDGGRSEGALAAQKLVEDHSHRPHVRAMIDDLARNLLRSHVVRRSHDETGLGLDGGAFAERDTEIEDLCGAAREHLDVARLHVPVDYAPFVRVIEPAADLGDDVDAVLEPLGLLRLHELSEAHAFQELHHDVGGAFALELPEIEDGDDVRMLEVRRGLRFPLKAAPHLLLDEELLGHHFDRHQTIEPRVAGLVDGPHGAAAKLRQDLVFSNPGWRRGHNALVSDGFAAHG